jgi:hypothetical protein
LFGTLFNQMTPSRSDGSIEGPDVQQMIVPISYGPYQKFLARITQDPELDRKTAITLPRMAFEINGMQYDSSRKIGSLKKVKSFDTGDYNYVDYQYSPAPYNIEFSLYIMTKYAEDGAQILEQILPFYKPDWTTTVTLIDGIEPFDVPLVLNSVGSEDIYEGDFETRRSLLWTLNFTMKAWFFGPTRQKKIVKFVDTRITVSANTSTDNTTNVWVYPGLNEFGEPTTNRDDTILYSQIEVSDDWGIIKVFTDGTIET